VCEGGVEVSLGWSVTEWSSGTVALYTLIYQEPPQARSEFPAHDLLQSVAGAREAKEAMLLSQKHCVLNSTPKIGSPRDVQLDQKY